MRPDQAVGWTLNQTSAITAIVSSRIFFGNRLGNGTAGTIILPAINYFELPGTRRYNGFEFATYSFNCRASAASVSALIGWGRSGWRCPLERRSRPWRRAPWRA